MSFCENPQGLSQVHPSPSLAFMKPCSPRDTLCSPPSPGPRKDTDLFLQAKGYNLEFCLVLLCCSTSGLPFHTVTILSGFALEILLLTTAISSVQTFFSSYLCYHYPVFSLIHLFIRYGLSFRRSGLSQPRVSTESKADWLLKGPAPCFSSHDRLKKISSSFQPSDLAGAALGQIPSTRQGINQKLAVMLSNHPGRDYRP